MVILFARILLGFVLFVGLLFGVMYWQAQAALDRLGALMADPVTRHDLPAHPLNPVQDWSLFLVAQVLPLRQPGGPVTTPGRVFRDCDACPEMVEIPPGYYLRGSPLFEDGRYTHIRQRSPFYRQLRHANREGPRAVVRIPKPLAFSRTEITYAEWMDAQTDLRWSPVTGIAPYFMKDAKLRDHERIEQVDWYDADAYARFMADRTGRRYRLPTDSEWEYAARAGTVTRYHWGNGLGVGHAACRGCSTNPPGELGDVALYPPNGFGLHDMNGNGNEWVQDCFIDWLKGDPLTGAAVEFDVCAFRTFRGGSAVDGAWQSRTAFRVGPHAWNDHEDSTIRLVREMDPAEATAAR